MTEAQKVPDVRKTVTVDVPADRAFAIFAERPIEWFPEKHVFVENRVSLTIEPFEGGRYYEVGADGTEIAWGTVVEWNPPKRIVLTWRVGPHWQPVFDDEKASFIEVDFEALGPGRTSVALTHSGLHRHGEIAPLIHAALDGPSPGETLARYEQVVARVGAAASPVPVTLVNRFQVTGPAERFEEVFAATSAFFAAQPGFIEHTLHRRLDEPTSYVNIARWTDGASLRAAVAQPEFQPHSAALRELAVSGPELFEVRLNVKAADAE
ncbi:antibiotic biosynthesis monooxygenase [Streptomyces sp. T028]|uniref:antibiotic biosynthesis monooxygenase n=1 Tax=Streptomyces sp. T028 TaxID=3394379 RepID=UPI003A87C378